MTNTNVQKSFLHNATKNIVSGTTAGMATFYLMISLTINFLKHFFKLALTLSSYTALKVG